MSDVADFDGLPAGPRTPAPLQLLGVMHWPFTLLDGCARRFGGCFTLRPSLFPPLVVVSDREDVGKVFAADMPRSTPATEGYPLDPNRLMKSVFGDSSFVFRDGGDLHAERRLMAPALRPERLAAFDDQVCRAVEESIAEWPRGRPFRLHRRVRRIAIVVLLRTLARFRDPAREARLTLATETLLELTDRPTTLLGLSLADRADGARARVLGGLPRIARAARCREEIFRLYEEEVEARSGARDLAGDTSLLTHLVRERPTGGVGKGPREVAEAVHSLVLGSETAAAAMTWALSDVLRESQARERVEREIADAFGRERPAAAAYPDLPFFEAAVQESLRLHPVLAWIWRTPEEPIRLSGGTVPPGVVVLPTLYLANRDPKRWRDPGTFRPERFLGRSHEAATFFPFGAGAHGCPGSAMAVPMLKHFVVRTLQLTRLHATGTRTPASRIDVATASPADGLRVVETSRRRAA